MSTFAQNQLLARLPKDESVRLSRFVEPVSLKTKQILYNVRAPLDYVYFPISGIISAMTMMENGDAIEVATVGNEGLAGLTAFNGAHSSPYQVMVQVQGDGLRMNAETFKTETKRDGPLREIVVRYNTAFTMQVSYSVACNGLHKVEQRCSRWLLMTVDRVGNNVVPLTHEFLAIMLGVRRASITEVLRPLQEAGVIHNGRGVIEILDRPKLEKLACECYRVVKDEFARLFR